MSATDLTLRAMGDDLSWEELTALLHRAYAGLAAEGLRFLASHQALETTKKRGGKGECWVGLRDGRLVCTITVIAPDRCGGAPWYDRPEVAKIEQYAVDPAERGRGVGGALLDLAERRAREQGARELALDTAEGATRLIETYTRRGYRFIEYVDWRPSTNYRSVLLSKAL